MEKTQHKYRKTQLSLQFVQHKHRSDGTNYYKADLQTNGTHTTTHNQELHRTKSKLDNWSHWFHLHTVVETLGTTQPRLTWQWLSHTTASGCTTSGPWTSPPIQHVRRQDAPTFAMALWHPTGSSTTVAHIGHKTMAEHLVITSIWCTKSRSSTNQSGELPIHDSFGNWVTKAMEAKPPCFLQLPQPLQPPTL